MAGALRGVRRSLFPSRMWRTNAPPEPFGIFQRSSSVSISDLRPKSFTAAPHPLKRRRSISFSFGLCFRANGSLDPEDSCILPVKSDLQFRRGSGQRDAHPKEGVAWYLRWWREISRPFGRRRSKNDTLAENLDSDHQVFYRPTKWKLLLRRLRAETSKMNCTNQTSPGFHYDALSYAKNFDDGCWQQCDSHARGRFSQDVFPASLAVESGSFERQLTGESCHVHDRRSIVWREPASVHSRADISLWQRRNVSQPPALDVKVVGV